jgi:hypothetical protein
VKRFFIDCDDTRLDLWFQKVSKFDVCEKMIVAGVKFLMEKRLERAKSILMICGMIYCR